MTGQKLVLKPHSRHASRRSVTTTAVDLTEDGFNNLASSHPIPLGDLYSRANSRNKASRSRRSHHHVRRSLSENPEHLESRMSYSEGNPYKHRTRASHQHHPGSDQGMLESYRSESAGQAHLHTPESIGQAWAEDGAARIHHPLSYSDGYASQYYRSLPQRHNNLSESPFAQNYDYLRSADMLPAPFGKSNMQSELYRQDYMPETSFHVYDGGFGRSYNVSPYESLPQYPQVQEGLELQPPTFDLQHTFSIPENERYVQYTPVRADETRSSARQRELNSETEPNPAELPSRRQKSISDEGAVRLYLEERRNKSRSKVPGPEEKGPVKNKRHDRKEEYHAFLDDVFQKSKISDKRTVFHVSPGETKPATTKESRKLLDERAKVTERKVSGIHAEVFGNEATAKPEYSQNHTRDLSSATRKVLRPPPGLPQPAANALLPEPEPSERHSVATQARLEEANNWFHQGVRKEEPHRLKILRTVRDYIEKYEGNSETLLFLSKVITNLLLGYDKRNPDYFSNFKDVNLRYCDTSNPERRSFFETDPFINHRVPPPRRAHSRQSHDKEKKMVLIRQRRPEL